MDNVTGISASFIGKQDLVGVDKTTKKDDTQVAATTQKAVAAASQQKNAKEILNSMHYMGVQNLVNVKVSTMQADPKMASRIGEFMANFETEVQKGLKVIAKDFPSMDKTTAAMIAAKAALKAADLDD